MADLEGEARGGHPRDAPVDHDQIPVADLLGEPLEADLDQRADEQLRLPDRIRRADADEDVVRLEPHLRHEQLHAGTSLDPREHHPGELTERGLGEGPAEQLRILDAQLADEQLLELPPAASTARLRSRTKSTRKSRVEATIASSRPRTPNG